MCDFEDGADLLRGTIEEVRGWRIYVGDEDEEWNEDERVATCVGAVLKLDTFSPGLCEQGDVLVLSDLADFNLQSRTSSTYTGSGRYRYFHFSKETVHGQN